MPAQLTPAAGGCGHVTSTVYPAYAGVRSNALVSCCAISCLPQELSATLRWPLASAADSALASLVPC